MNQLVHSGQTAAIEAALKTAGKATTRTNDPARTIAGILEVATREFAEKGLSGARIDAIAAATRTSKRMIYYHFNSNEGLYVAVLEDAYRRMRDIEAELHLENLAPEAALRRLAEFTFDQHWSHPDFIRLVMNENIERGVTQGVFRPGVDAVDIHASISALTSFIVSNQHTFGLIFSNSGQPADAPSRRRQSIVEMIVRFVQA